MAGSYTRGWMSRLLEDRGDTGQVGRDYFSGREWHWHFGLVVMLCQILDWLAPKESPAEHEPYLMLALALFDQLRRQAAFK